MEASNIHFNRYDVGMFKNEGPVRETQLSFDDCAHYTLRAAENHGSLNLAYVVVDAVLLHPVHASGELLAPYVFYVYVPIQASRIVHRLPRLG